jgi:hypothetical protein
VKFSRVLLIVILGVAVVLAWLVRARSVETGESYAEALRGVLAQLRDAGAEAGGQVKAAVQDGRLAARRREEAFDRELAAAERSA